jgi:phosphoenolpyruvate-protein kinase (PTS system EI component)
MAGDPAHVPALVAAGLRVFSVAASRLGPTKAALAATGAGDG